MTKKPKILFYDIETTPLRAYIWQLGKQVVRHHQLDKKYARYGIICVTYCWNDERPAKCIDWGYKEQDTSKVIQEFDEIIKQADFAIGKNSDRFDAKMINACRMFANLPAMPDWVKYTEDLEKQMRKYFRLPSYSLDYISDQFGLGGKIKMEFEDWVDIIEKSLQGKFKFNKMREYGKKDVEDTRALWNKLSAHFETKINLATFNKNKFYCPKCGSSNYWKHGLKFTGKTLWQRFRCNDCGGMDRLPAGQCRGVK